MCLTVNQDDVLNIFSKCTEIFLNNFPPEKEFISHFSSLLKLTNILISSVVKISWMLIKLFIIRTKIMDDLWKIISVHNIQNKPNLLNDSDAILLLINLKL